MSTKLLVDAACGTAQPIVWRSTAGPAQKVAPFPQLTAPPAQASDENPSQLLSQQQQRIVELERLMEQRVRDSHQQGYVAGAAAGAQQAQQSLDAVIARFAKAVEELANLRRRVRSEAEEDAVRLALAVARKILHREITVDSDSLLGLVKAALQRVDAREIHRLRMSPDDIPAIERHLQSLGAPARLEVIADPTLERGGMIFETERGNLDASITTQLSEVERGFIDIVRRSHNAV